MTVTHKKGQHGITELWIPRFWTFARPTVVSYAVTFDASARCERAENNKVFDVLFYGGTLFGVAFLSGWRYEWKWLYSPSRDRVELFQYVTPKNGNIQQRIVTSVAIGERVQLSLAFTDAGVRFIAKPDSTMDDFRTIYTGGRYSLFSRIIGPEIEPAPHDITIEFERL
jgi:hypothetical protein